VVSRACTAALLAACGKEEPHPRYNVLLVTLDTTRVDHLGCYGYQKNTSPRLDELAGDAVRFETAITTAAITPIAHASIFTGLNPYQHGVRIFYGPAGHYLEPSIPSLAPLLKSRGWRTGAFISAYPASERFGLHWGFDTFETEVAESVMEQDPSLPFPIEGRWMNKKAAMAQRRADSTTDQALEWLSQAERPFYLWLHLFDPHDNTLVPPFQYFKEFGHSKGDSLLPIHAYDPEIFFMDQQLGRVLDFLKERGEYDRTLIVVVSDHGQGHGQHGWYLHRLLYQEQIHVPLIVRIPGEKAGTIPDMVRTIDVMPTILDALAVQKPSNLEGKSLLGLIQGREEEAPRLAYAEALNLLDEHAPDFLPDMQKDNLFCVFDGTWKLIYHKESPANSELYNLAEDPKELRNLAEQQPEVVARLAADIARSGAMKIEIKDPEEPMDPEAREKLNALGYTGGSK